MDGNKWLRSLIEIKETLNLKKNFTIIKDILQEPSLYAGMPRKSFTKRLYENLKWYLFHWEPCRYYNSYGFDIVGFRNQKEYLAYRQFRIERNNENYAVSPFHPYRNQTLILRDKILFAAFFGQLLGTEYVVETYGSIEPDGQVYDLQTHQFTRLETLLQKHSDDLFVKKLFGECGDGCYVFNAHTAYLADVLARMRGSKYIIQPRLVQHPGLDRLNPSCINTVRLSTVFGPRTQQAYILAHALRVGIDKINDNQSTGGLAVAIETNGKLGPLGIGHHQLATQHPVTHFTFAGYELPFWSEIQQLALRAHACLPQVRSIGWDIALTPSGPVLLEGNDNWEIALHQESKAGLKDKWYKLHNL